MTSFGSLADALAHAEGTPQPVVGNDPHGGTSYVVMPMVDDVLFGCALRRERSDWLVVEATVRSRGIGVKWFHDSSWHAHVDRAIELAQASDGASDFLSITDAVVAPFLRSRRTRQPYDRADLARLALEYVARACDPLDPDSNPAKTLAREYPETSAKTWANLFTKARAAGLLTPPPRRGVAGGDLTPEGWNVVSGTVGYVAPRWAGDHFAETDDDLQDLLNARLNHQSRKQRGDLSESEIAQYELAERRAARVNGRTPRDIRGEVRRRQAVFAAHVEREWIRQVEQTQTVDDLKALWARERSVFEANPRLMDAWKARGRSLRDNEERAE